MRDPRGPTLAQELAREEARDAALSDDGDCRRKEEGHVSRLSDEEEARFAAWRRGYAKGWESGQAEMRELMGQLRTENEALRDRIADLEAMLADVPKVLIASQPEDDQ